MKYLLLILILSGCSSSEKPEILSTESSRTLVQDVNKNKEVELIKESTIEKNILAEEEEIKEEVEVIEETQEVVYDELSLPTLKKSEITGTDLALEQVLSTNNIYTRYRVSYMSGDLKISGIMNIPTGDGPYPLLILAHGYIDISVYTNGRGLKREQNYFANNGFAVFHPDYRNHAYSDTISEVPYDFRLGYTQDVIAAILSAQNSELSELKNVDTSKVGLLGHSMGSGVSQNIAVIRPDLVQAIVLYGPVSNNEYTNFEQFQMSKASRSNRVEQVFNDYNTPEENPFFWDNIASKVFFKDIKAPIQIYSGTNDTDTPTAWAEAIRDDLEENNKEVELIQYPGEGHEFGPRWNDFMNGSGEFFSEILK